MRLFSIILVLVLVGAVLAPMYIKGPNGQPIMTADDWVPEKPAALAPDKPVYKWRDEFGVWQFGENPPEGVDAVPTSIDPDSSMTVMGDEWNVEDLVNEPKRAKPPTADFTMSSPMDVYQNAPKLIEAAKQAANQMSKHTQELDAVTP